MLDALKKTDQEVYELVREEERRQFDKLRLIPSENYVSQAVLEATGSVLTNKYSEGYPGKRYYEGQQVIDSVEKLARKRAKKLFGAKRANVQPYSGSPANLAVYFGLLKPGDKVMGMALPHGGHLTHGWNVSITGSYYESCQYTGHPDTGFLDYDMLRDQARKEKPQLLIAGATAYPRIIDFEAFASIANEVGAYLLVDMAHIAGLVAGGAHPSPVPHAHVVSTTTHKTLRGPRGGLLLYTDKGIAKQVNRAVFPGLQGGPHNHTTAALAVALHEADTDEFKAYAAQVVANAKALAERLNEHGFKLVTGGTDNHLVLMDVTTKGVGGKPLAKALDRAGVVCNYNTVPFDPNPPMDPSGVRLGTPSLTTRGMKEDAMVKVADWINEVTGAVEDEATLDRIAAEVREFCKGYPAPGLEHLV